jgi:hypothetical protein
VLPLHCHRASVHSWQRGGHSKRPRGGRGVLVWCWRRYGREGGNGMARGAWMDAVSPCMHIVHLLQYLAPSYFLLQCLQLLSSSHQGPQPGRGVLVWCWRDGAGRVEMGWREGHGWMLSHPVSPSRLAVCSRSSLAVCSPSSLAVSSTVAASPREEAGPVEAAGATALAAVRLAAAES